MNRPDRARGPYTDVIFDMGGVLLEWNPRLPCRAVGAGDDETLLLVQELITHPEWVEMDRGLLSAEEARRRAAGRTGLPVERLRDVMEAVPGVMKPMSATVAILKDLKARGTNCWVLSNMHVEYARYLEDTLDFLGEFSGVVFSCDVGLAKPDEEIWPLTLDRFGLEAAATVFIDDSLPNIRACGEAGITGILFTDPDSVRRELSELGLLD